MRTVVYSNSFISCEAPFRQTTEYCTDEPRRFALEVVVKS
jgi:hypothetical protein